MNSETDEELMARIQNRDKEALTLLYYRHSKLLGSVISRCVYDVHHSEDLLQEVFVEIWERAGQYSEEKGRALGWLITLARRRALDRVRRFQVYFRVLERKRNEDTRDNSNKFYESSTEAAPSNDNSKLVHECMAELPPLQAQVLRLVADGLTQREIVARLNTPLGTIKTRIELGLRKLKEMLTCRFKEEFSSGN